MTSIAAVLSLAPAAPKSCDGSWYRCNHLNNEICNICIENIKSQTCTCYGNSTNSTAFMLMLLLIVMH